MNKDPWDGLDRDEEPWATLDAIWRKLWEHREELLEQRSQLGEFTADLGYLDGQLAASSFVQSLIFAELLKFMQRNKSAKSE
jgi:hypothetical protein